MIRQEDTGTLLDIIQGVLDEHEWSGFEHYEKGSGARYGIPDCRCYDGELFNPMGQGVKHCMVADGRCFPFAQAGGIEDE